MLHTGLQDELVELFASMDKAKGGVESGFINKVNICLGSLRKGMWNSGNTFAD